MASAADRPVEWRFGERPEDGAAWLAHPDELHAYVDFRPPDSTRWHRVVVATDRQIGTLVSGAAFAIVPAMLVVRHGSAEEMRARVDDGVRTGWRLLVNYATILPEDHEPVEW